MATCKLCGVEIHFAPNQRGTLTPYTRDGTNHFTNCPVYQARRNAAKRESPVPTRPLFDEPSERAER